MKKFISFLLAAVLLVSAVPMAHATNDYTAGTKVEYTAANTEAYTITVPAQLAPGGSGTVTLQGTWASDRVVSVTADKNVVLTNSINAADKKTLNVSFPGIDEYGSNTTSQTFTETVSVAGISDALFGTWSGRFYYNVSITSKNTSNDESIANFVNNISSHQSSNSFTFAFLSDAHTGYYKDKENASITKAAQVVAEIDGLDLVIHGGDLVSGGAAETVEMTYEHVGIYKNIMQSNIPASVPSLWLIGNHDDAPYQETANRLTQTQTFELFGSQNSASGATFNNNCNYGYLDFDNEKIRVIYLDTHDRRSWESNAQEGTESDYLNIVNIGGEQLNWLANTALDFSSKANPNDWGVIVTSHAELDCTNRVYTEPTTGNTYDWNTINALNILSAYEKGKSGTIVHNGISVSYDFSDTNARASIYCAVYGHGHKYTDRTVDGILLIGCPNISSGRERVSDDGITYSTEVGETSFCAITIDTGTKKIYADHYGPGYDRVFDYVPTEEDTYTNQLPISIGADGSVYNGTGYKVDTYISSGNEGSRNGVYCSGFIPCSIKDILRFQNCTIASSDNTRFAFYDENMNFLALVKTTNTNYTGFTWDDNGNLLSIQLNNRCAGDGNNEKIAYVRFCCGYLGEDSIVTVNEEIE